jgi:hypothetical protein
MGIAPAHARRIWQRIEAVHALTYFAPACLAANKAVGLRGFWMGYFGARAAPLGPVGPAVVEATFYNFAASMVERAIPDAWGFAAPDEIVAARRAAAATALREVAGPVDALADELAAALAGAVAAADAAGRPLFAANRALAPAADPVERLWQMCTSLREHRGDGHVAALTAAGLDGCEVHVLFAANHQVPAETLRDNRGWSTEDWAAAASRLERRGLVHGDRATRAGASLHERIEQTTDELAAAPYAALAADDLEVAERSLDTVASAVVAAGVIPFPNPMGLPAPDPPR